MAQVSPNPANMITVIEIATGPIGPPGPIGASGSIGETGPSGLSQPFEPISQESWETTSSLQVTGSLTVSDTFTNIGPAIFSSSIYVKNPGYIFASRLDGSDNGFSEVYYSNSPIEGFVGVYPDYAYSAFNDGTNYNEMQLYGDKTIFLQPIEVLSVTSSFVGSLEGTSSWAEHALTASYVNLVAGNNIVINYKEDNSIEISGSEGIGTPGGSPGQIQYNLNNNFDGSPYFIYDITYKSLNQGENPSTLNLYSHAEGANTRTLGYSSHAEGSSTLTEGTSSHAEGFFTSASGDYSHAEGWFTSAMGANSHAEGNSTISSGSNSHAEGDNTQAIGESSHAEGYYTTAKENYSHAEGNNTYTSGESSHAEGYFTSASGLYSHAEGNTTLTIGESSHAEGYNTIAYGDYSHAEGQFTIASGSYSHAEGSSSIAYGIASHAGGLHTIASGSYQTTIGQYNKHNNTTDLFVVGNGSSNSNRKDIFNISTTSVTITGSVNITGSISLNNILTLTPQHPLPSGVNIGSFAVSSSNPPIPYFYNGTSWKAISLI